MRSLPNDETGEALRQLEANGSDLSKPLNIDFFIAVPSKLIGEEIAILVRNLGFNPSVEQDNETDDWTCYCTIKIVPDYNEIISIPQKLLKNGNIIDFPDLPFDIEIIQFHNNSKPINRSKPKDDFYHGLAKNFLLIPIKNEKEVIENRSGITFKISGIDSNSDGIYSLLLGQSIKQVLQFKNNSYILELRRERIHLPFAIELLDFERVLHPGTVIPKSFSSEVNLIENMISRRVLIKMNEPLRHLNYTFFQASFSQNDNVETSVLAVVKNYGRLFPYISSLIMSFGLLIHLLIQIPKLITTKNQR